WGFWGCGGRGGARGGDAGQGHCLCRRSRGGPLAWERAWIRPVSWLAKPWCASSARPRLPCRGAVRDSNVGGRGRTITVADPFGICTPFPAKLDGTITVSQGHPLGLV